MTGISVTMSDLIVTAPVGSQMRLRDKALEQVTRRRLTTAQSEENARIADGLRMPSGHTPLGPLPAFFGGSFYVVYFGLNCTCAIRLVLIPLYRLDSVFGRLFISLDRVDRMLVFGDQTEGDLLEQACADAIARGKALQRAFVAPHEDEHPIRCRVQRSV